MQALTGTKDSREEFQQLLEDSKAGKIDMIITKSISRFSRNTMKLLETVRELDKLNVDVFFEEQNIHSISSEGEMVQLIYKLYVDGNGAEAICQILNAKGIKPKESKK